MPDGVRPCPPSQKCCLPDNFCLNADPECCVIVLGGRVLIGACADLPFPCGEPSGGDLCPDAQLIGGEGTFPFDNSAATGAGPDHAACNFSGQIGIDNDVWFCWRATCNDDDPADGMQSTATFGAVNGQTYLIRIDTFPGAAGGTGQFSIMCAGP